MDVYIEFALINNLIMDYFLLKISTTLCRAKTSFLRLFSAAFIGAVVAVVLPLFNVSKVVAFVFKLILGFLIAFISADYKSFIEYFKTVNVFIFTTFFTGGMIFAVLHFLEIDYKDVNVWNYNSVLPIGVNFLCVYLIFKIIIKTAIRIYKIRDTLRYTYKCVLTLDGQKFHLKGFVDSGNGLWDERSGLPITVISKRAIKQAFYSRKDKHYVKINTVSGEAFMEVFFAESIEIGDDKPITVYRPPIGISPTDFKIPLKDGCDLLLSPSLLAS